MIEFYFIMAENKVGGPSTGVDDVKRKKGFKKNTYRGIELSDLLDKNVEEMAKLYRARQRRSFKRGLPSKFTRLFNNLLKAKKKAPPGEKPKGVKTHLRNCIITPEMVHSIIEIHNGHKFIPVEIRPEMIGYYLGEFSITYHPVSHGKPGVGSTRGSKFSGKGTT